MSKQKHKVGDFLIRVEYRGLDNPKHILGVITGIKSSNKQYPYEVDWTTECHTWTHSSSEVDVMKARFADYMKEVECEKQKII